MRRSRDVLERCFLIISGRAFQLNIIARVVLCSINDSLMFIGIFDDGEKNGIRHDVPPFFFFIITLIVQKQRGTQNKSSLYVFKNNGNAHDNTMKDF